MLQRSEIIGFIFKPIVRGRSAYHQDRMALMTMSSRRAIIGTDWDCRRLQSRSRSAIIAGISLVRAQNIFSRALHLRSWLGNFESQRRLQRSCRTILSQRHLCQCVSNACSADLCLNYRAGDHTTNGARTEMRRPVACTVATCAGNAES